MCLKTGSIGMGAALGLINGLIIAYGRVPAIITTLGTLNGTVAIDGDSSGTFRLDNGGELIGDVQNVFFPCAALTEGDRISVYYGAADTVTGLAHGHISDLIDFARER